MEDPMAVPGMWFAFGILFLFTAILIVVIWQIFSTRRANAALTRDDAYRKLAEQATSAQQRTADDLTDLRQRVERIEKILSQVE
jgi:hypothetical protein